MTSIDTLPHLIRSSAAAAARAPQPRLPHVVVAGSARECGHAYGAAAREQIRSTIAGYRALFEAVGGLDWETARARALRHCDALAVHALAQLEQLEGIAEGAEVAFEDVLAINCRTELLAHARAGAGAPPPGECSVVGGIRADGTAIAGQNWDWLPFSRETLVELVVRPQDGVGYTTVVEAGLLAKMGLNAAGLGVLTNGLATTGDGELPGVPYHALLARLLASGSLDAALDVLRATPRGSSGNYLLVTADRVVDVETRPGGADALAVVRGEREREPLLHTNHFLWSSPQDRELSSAVAPSSVSRLARLRRQLAENGELTPARIAELLSDHDGHPWSICGHEDPASPPHDRWCTLASVIVDPARRALWVAPGAPCTVAYALAEAA